MLTITNEDNMALMARYPDKYFDLAIVDPPYGINASNVLSGTRRKSGNGKACKSAFEAKDWDLTIPDPLYFKELFRVSKNQIIWGANYMVEYLPNSQGWVVWNKDNGTTNFADCEIAFTSFNVATRMFTFTWNGMLQGDMKNKEIRLHPTQKPVALYKWLLDKYAKQGDKILDTHLGSGSIAIACHDYGFDLTACELDKEYFDKAMNRINNHMAQQKLIL
jgi:site-specific DNA-methyltransferase (adenine-specific)